MADTLSPAADQAQMAENRRVNDILGSRDTQLQNQMRAASRKARKTVRK